MQREVVLPVLAAAVMVACLAAGACRAGAQHAPPPRQPPSGAASGSRPVRTEVARRPLGEGREVVLSRSPDGDGFLAIEDPSGARHELACERLQGAWGLWLTDVDGDGRAEALVALRKRARFDPVVANRLHVYALVRDRCVPLWRGTRLAGRFEALAQEAGGAPGTLLAYERVGGRGRRVARYRWADFGFVLDRVLWSGRGSAPARFARLLVSPDRFEEPR